MTWRVTHPFVHFRASTWTTQSNCFFKASIFTSTAFRESPFRMTTSFKALFTSSYYYLRCKNFQGTSFHSLKYYRGNMKQSSKKQCMFMFYLVLRQPLKNNSCKHHHLKFNAPAAKANKSIQIHTNPSTALSLKLKAQIYMHQLSI